MKKTIITTVVALFVLSFAGFGFAGAKTGDISVDSDVGDVTNMAVGNKVEAETNVHSVDVKSGSKTGDISIKGKAGNINNMAGVNKSKATTNVGSVKVGE